MGYHRGDEINCPYIEGQWPDACSDGLTLEIFRQKSDKGLQMFAGFNFGIVKGTFC